MNGLDANESLKFEFSVCANHLLRIFKEVSQESPANMTLQTLGVLYRFKLYQAERIIENNFTLWDLVSTLSAHEVAPIIYDIGESALKGHLEAGVKKETFISRTSILNLLEEEFTTSAVCSNLTIEQILAFMEITKVYMKVGKFVQMNKSDRTNINIQTIKKRILRIIKTKFDSKLSNVIMARVESSLFQNMVPSLENIFTRLNFFLKLVSFDIKELSKES